MKKKTRQRLPVLFFSQLEYDEGKKVMDNPDLQPITAEETQPAKRVVDAAEERKKLENTAFEQDIRLKRVTLFTLFTFLGIETGAVFVFAFFQATHAFGFALEEWSFRLILAATITQITLMVQIAVKHLFPVATQNNSSTGSSTDTQTSTPATSRS